MDTRAFDDWSPASVFGATVSARDRSRQDGKRAATDDGRATRENHHGEIRHNRSLINATERAKAPAPEETDDDDEDDGQACVREDDAARVLQKRGRVWLLCRRELESYRQVEQLRTELEQVAASAIVEWLRRSRRRVRLLQYATQLSRQRAAGKCLVRWLHWQCCVAHARRTLQQRISARRCIACWWRRVALKKRCHRRQRQKDDRAREQRDWAYRVTSRFVRRVIRRRRAIQRATECVQTFGWAVVQRQRAGQEAQRRRHRRHAVHTMDRLVTRWGHRRTVTWWRDYADQQREAEACRRHHAACVLQRLVRVVLTAFRLLRRRDAATHIQSRVRAHHQRRRYNTLRRERQRVAATQIQRVVRGFVARRRLARVRQQLRERFKCLNCGLIEPGGLYCKFCGRRRTTFDVLHAGAARGSCTTESKLRTKRRKAPTLEEASPRRPPAPPAPIYKREGGPSVWVMTVPEFAPPSPSRTLPTVNAQPPRVLHQEVTLLLSPIRPPRQPTQVRAASGRPSLHHRSLSLTQAPPPGMMAPMTGVASADKTRQRAEALLLQQQRDIGDPSSTMALHLKRLQQGGKAASR